MGRQARGGLGDPGVREVRDQIERWRRTRTKRSPMPAGLWAKAVALARTSGLCPIARALRVDYASLARRLEADGGERSARIESGGFVELRGADLLGGGTVVEVAEADGARLTIRLAAGHALDAPALVGAFRRRDA